MSLWQWWLIIGMANLAFDLLWPRAIADMREVFELEYDPSLPPAVNAFLCVLAIFLYIVLWPIWFLVDVGLAIGWLQEKWDNWKNGGEA